MEGTVHVMWGVFSNVYSPFRIEVGVTQSWAELVPPLLLLTS